MATTSVQNVSISIRLNNGVDAQGNTKTIGISLGSLSASKFNADKVLAIVSALGPVLDKSIEGTEKIEVSSLSA